MPLVFSLKIERYISIPIECFEKFLFKIDPVKLEFMSEA